MCYFVSKNLRLIIYLPSQASQPLSRYIWLLWLWAWYGTWWVLLLIGGIRWWYLLLFLFFILLCYLLYYRSMYVSICVVICVLSSSSPFLFFVSIVVVRLSPFIIHPPFCFFVSRIYMCEDSHIYILDNPYYGSLLSQ